MKSKFVQGCCWITVSVILAGCAVATDDDAKITSAVVSLNGHSRATAEAAFGDPYYTVISKGVATSYWLMTQTEEYLGVSNKRIIRQVDGRPVVHETEGVLMKQHRHKCVVEIKSDATSTIIESNIHGNARGCKDAIAKLSRTSSQL